MNAYTPVVWKNAMLIIGTTMTGTTGIARIDVSDHVKSLTLTRKFDLLDDTRMGLTAHSRIPGLEMWTAEAELIQEFLTTQSGGAGLDGFLASLIGVTPIPIEIRPVNAIRTSDNPGFIGNAIMESYTPFKGEAGSLLTTVVPFQSAGSLTRIATSS
jgi:hypothetical protein